MYGQLGDIIYQNAYGFDALDTGRNAVYAEHQRLNRKPKLQLMGLELQDIDVKIVMHSSICNPPREIDKVEAYRNRGEVLPYVSGNGRLVGYFVISGFRLSILAAFPDGTIQHCEVSLKLREHVGPPREQQRAKAAQERALAVASNQPIERIPSRAVQPPEAAISQDIQVAQIETTAAIQETAQAQNPSERERLLNRVARRCRDARARLDAAVDELTNADSPYYDALALISSARSLGRSLETLQAAAANVNDIDSALAAARATQSTAGQFEGTSAAFSAQIASRRI